MWHPGVAFISPFGLDDSVFDMHQERDFSILPSVHAGSLVQPAPAWARAISALPWDKVVWMCLENVLSTSALPRVHPLPSGDRCESGTWIGE